MGQRKRDVKLKPGERRHKGLEECLADLKRAIERGAKRYLKSRHRSMADSVD